ncbi:hypothetical protein IMZ48_19410 [Candidatus Bathyarchaeota archaeon]|nr:hypothetical protein [Candidatus Bathyarchaeota archaeon]
MQRVTLLLKEASAPEVPEAFDASAQPQYFRTPELRSEVESLQLSYKSPDETLDQPASKRRKVEASPATGLTTLSDLIFEIVEPIPTATEGFEEIIVYVLKGPLFPWHHVF